MAISYAQVTPNESARSSSSMRSARPRVSTKRAKRSGRTVTDLVAGSGIEFEDRGEHELRGVAGTWRLFAVSA
jgi:hypothetical protein